MLGIDTLVLAGHVRVDARRRWLLGAFHLVVEQRVRSETEQRDRDGDR